MVNILLQIVGLACLGAFAFIAWPPLLLLFAGVVLTVGPEMADR